MSSLLHILGVFQEAGSGQTQGSLNRNSELISININISVNQSN